jgi:predicted nucleic acid-binding protein
MKIVVDSNRAIASLLKDSTTREILYNRSFEFVAPEFIKDEILKYKSVFIKKGVITKEEFDILLSLIFERITLIPKNEYAKYLKKLETEISDSKDIPYLACCISTKAEGIWSHDPHLLGQDKLKVFTNKDLLDMSRS